ncbi:MAG: flagellar basal body P-ring formation chaperone FlgA [Desulfatirhabdiaceae bacterium]
MTAIKSAMKSRTTSHGVSRNRMISLFSAGFLLMSLVFVSTVLSADREHSPITIALDSSIEIDSPKMTFGDIAEISGGAPDDIQRIREISLGNSPMPGKSRFLDERYLRLRLKQSNVDEDNILLVAANSVEVVRKHVELTKSQIEEMVMAFLNPRLPWNRDRMSISFSGGPDSLVLSDSDYSCQISLPDRTRLMGSILMQVQFFVAGQLEKKIWVTARITVKTDVVVIQKPLHRKQLIQEEHIDIIEMDMAELPSNHISSPEEVIGKRALRTINPKEILRTDMIELPPLIKRNDMVTIVAESGSLRITARGEAKENGRRGERVKVVNLDSSKEIFARILDSKTVRVEF